MVRRRRDRRCRRGRWQERLAGRDVSRAGGSRRAGTERVREHIGCVPGDPGRNGHRGRDLDDPGGSRSRRRRRSHRTSPPGPLADPVGGSARCVRRRDLGRLRRTVSRSRHGGRRSGGPFERHRRGPARGVVRRPAGDLPDGAGGRRAHRCCSSVFRQSLHRAGDQLSRSHGHRRRGGGALGRRAAHGALGPGIEWRHVHARHRFGLP